MALFEIAGREDFSEKGRYCHFLFGVGVVIF